MRLNTTQNNENITESDDGRALLRIFIEEVTSLTEKMPLRNVANFMGCSFVEVKNLLNAAKNPEAITARQERTLLYTMLVLKKRYPRVDYSEQEVLRFIK